MRYMNMRPSGRPCLPPPDRCELFIDFDGTITQTDILDELVSRYALNDSWQEIERQWQSGAIGSRECLSRQIALVRITPEELSDLLRSTELDPGVERILQLATQLQIPTTIVSDGVDFFIEHLLSRIEPSLIPENLTIRANTLRRHGDQYDLVCPHLSPTCESAAAHCKCRSAVLMHTPGRQSIHVGDGLSDLCPARRADAVFAKGRLAEALAREEIPYIPFLTLNDVAAVLEACWAQRFSSMRPARLIR